ncbi:hypothetical protein PPTG_15809 [Phytophthora nicotianae INRA-310]|uniref:Uncharacterized protein n=1 Tax=Phytophthora nicotianae (strain INRA-310) TaxID=761204 RepID=W2PQF2_PHYN3|nr:hypothetical protein PPTG_15809 [Phytophthora nicotianae INRA-310]ETN02851.1 hypothetical protein PPTG_15809 [Phytophthora nicotianae INRA-310]
MRAVARVFALLLFFTTALASVDKPRFSQSHIRSLFQPLHLRIILTGDSMQIHGQLVFDVFASPVLSADNSSVRYDGVATFIEDEKEFTYVLADGAAYLAESSRVQNHIKRKVRCLSTITPFDEIVSALNNLTVTPYSSIQDIPFDCASKTAYTTSFGGEKFVLCQARDADYGFVAYSDVVIMVVEYMSGDLNISAPTPTDGAKYYTGSSDGLHAEYATYATLLCYPNICDTSEFADPTTNIFFKSFLATKCDPKFATNLWFIQGGPGHASIGVEIDMLELHPILKGELTCTRWTMAELGEALD